MTDQEKQDLIDIQASEIERLQKALLDLHRDFAKVQWDNKLYRSALEYYSGLHVANWYDGGALAKQTLEEVQ